MSDFLPQQSPSSTAILDADLGVTVSYGQLLERVIATGECLRREAAGSLVFHIATNTVESIVLYLACLEVGCPVALLEPGTPGSLERLLRVYHPGVVLLPEGMDPPSGMQLAALPTQTYRMAVRLADNYAQSLHPDLALLLTTSGSTGSPKLVRLTRSNVVTNAHSIVSYLGIEPGERSVQSLPMHYSYGLSLVNSHLAAGAAVVLTRHSFLRPEFWGAFDRSQCTSFAGVPHVYETLDRLRFDPRRHPSLRTMTQAGGNLRGDLIRNFHDRLHEAGGRFYVMYGQTEASPRISYVPWERLGQKIGSIGIAIPRGRLALTPVKDSDQQELVYSGPNVMMGYAESAADLAAGDELKGTLRTGDLASVDEEGFYYLAGRLQRFAKLFGRRVSLEDVERDLESRYPIRVAATDRGGQLVVFAAAQEELDAAGVVQYLARRLGVPPQCVKVDRVSAIPVTASGKKDYKALPS